MNPVFKIIIIGAQGYEVTKELLILPKFTNFIMD